MDLMQFTQALSRIWVLETRLLDKAKIERMIEAPDADDVINKDDIVVAIGSAEDLTKLEGKIFRH